MRDRFLSFLALLVAFSVAVPAAAQPVGRDLYVVQAGDTLYRISRASGLSVDRLRELNNLTTEGIQVGQTLRLSTRVPLPDRTTAPPTGTVGGTGVAVPPRPTPDRPAPPAAGAAVHVVEPGDTLYRISLRYATSIETLRRANNLVDDRIEIGQRLVVGAGAATASPATASPATASPPAATPPGPAVVLRPVERRPWSTTNTTVAADLVHFVDPGETLYSIASAHRLTVDELAAGNALTTAPLVPGTVLYLPRAVEPALVAARGLPPPVSDGLALVYPDVMRGRPTASGEVYDPLQFTASHRTYPLGTVLLVTNPANSRSTFVRVIDRGPVSQSYLLELSAAAATVLELDPNTARRVDVRLLP